MTISISRKKERKSMKMKIREIIAWVIAIAQAIASVIDNMLM